MDPKFLLKLWGDTACGSLRVVSGFLGSAVGHMTNSGFKVLDSDMHIIEPADLWQRYIDPAFKERAPKGMAR